MLALPRALHRLLGANQPNRAAPVHIDQTISDFDGVIFHISTPESKTKILLSIQIRCFKDLVKYGAQEVLQREYGQYAVAAEPGYDFSVIIDLENLPADKGAVLLYGPRNRADSI